MILRWLPLWAILLPATAAACSVSLCSWREVEVRQNFIATVKFEGKPVAGAEVQIYPSSSNKSVRSVRTNTLGSAKIERLPPGDYWIDVRYLGVGARGDHHCFHVPSAPEPRAKGRLDFRWGDYPIALQSVSGIVEDRRGGAVPIEGAAATLRNARTRKTYHTTSDRNGAFAFPQVADGTYVLHFDASGNTYEESGFVIAVNRSAARDSIKLVRGQGLCAGPGLNPE